MARLKQVTESALAGDARAFESSLLAPEGLWLEPVPFRNPMIQLLWRQHYVGSKGTVGRQLHYLVYWNSVCVGGISAGSAMFAHRRRDAMLNVTPEERKAGLRHIVNNTLFRLVRPKEDPPLATVVLSAWRDRVKVDWQERYGDVVRAFETLVEPPRWGGIYRLDGWTRVGDTAGLGARRPSGHGTVGAASTGRRKIIRVPKKIVWAYPLIEYGEATSLSVPTRQRSYGEEQQVLHDVIIENGADGIALRAVAEITGISIERLRISLYPLVKGGQILVDDHERLRAA